MSNRISRLREKIANKSVEAILIVKPENIAYLTSFTGTSGMLLITKKQSFLLIDSRYEEQAAKEAPQVQLCLCEGDGFEGLLALVIRKVEAKVVGFESHVIPFADYESLKQKLAVDKPKEAKLKPLSKLVESLRVVKDKGEIEKITEAAKFSDKAFKHILAFIKPGLAEKEIALELEYFMRRLGADRVGFDIIVASGARSSMPHARTSDKRLKKGDFVKLDFGAVCCGYQSDMTRTVVLGKATSEQKKIYSLVLEAQRRACDGIKPGMLGREVDRIARDYFEEKGYSKEFGHNLGHGVGLEIHEAPTLEPESKEVLKENMVATVEPGLYFPGLGGVRIEDLVVLEEDGARVLTKSPKKLIEI